MHTSYLVSSISIIVAVAAVAVPADLGNVLGSTTIDPRAMLAERQNTNGPVGPPPNTLDTARLKRDIAAAEQSIINLTGRKTIPFEFDYEGYRKAFQARLLLLAAEITKRIEAGQDVGGPLGDGEKTCTSVLSQLGVYTKAEASIEALDTSVVTGYNNALVNGIPRTIISSSGAFEDLAKASGCPGKGGNVCSKFELLEEHLRAAQTHISQVLIHSPLDAFGGPSATREKKIQGQQYARKTVASGEVNQVVSTIGDLQQVLACSATTKPRALLAKRQFLPYVDIPGTLDYPRINNRIKYYEGAIRYFQGREGSGFLVGTFRKQLEELDAEFANNQAEAVKRPGEGQCSFVRSSLLVYADLEKTINRFDVNAINDPSAFNSDTVVGLVRTILNSANLVVVLGTTSGCPDKGGNVCEKVAEVEQNLRGQQFYVTTEFSRTRSLANFGGHTEGEKTQQRQTVRKNLGLEATQAVQFLFGELNTVLAC